MINPEKPGHVRSMKAFLHRFNLRRLIGILDAHVWLLSLLLCLASVSTLAQTSSGSASGSGSAVALEDRVKAASLHKFLNYVDWPPAAFAATDSPYVIGVVNAEDIAEELTRLAANRLTNNRPVLVKKIHGSDNVSGVHVLFIGRAERPRLSQWIRQTLGQPILLVSETEGALALGSMINFRIAEERVRFEVSLDPVEKSGLKLSSRMLAIAISVIKAGTP
ncbi:hypothetical protein BH11PSE11_BH11PSE11_24310 [soil metagenome]